MKIEHKSFAASGVKTLSKPEGICEAIVGVFGNVDHGGDKVMPGFFKESLVKKLPKGVWMHDWSTPVAKTLEARELPPGDALLPPALKASGGLYIKGQFNLDTQRGREAFSDLTFGTVDEFSFGYSVQEEDTKSERGVRRLIKGEIMEWSPVLMGMNPATQLIGTKRLRTDETKGEFLPNLEENVAASIFRTASDAMFYALMSMIVNDDDSVDMVATATGACNEFTAAILKAVTDFADSEDDEADDATIPHKTLAQTMSVKRQAIDLIQGAVLDRLVSTIDNNALSALAATAGRTLCERHEKHAKTRASEGRSLSPKRWDEIKTAAALWKTLESKAPATTAPADAFALDRARLALECDMLSLDMAGISI